MGWALVVHGGAGRPPRNLKQRRDALREALVQAREALRTGSALDAVEVAVSVMEDSGVLNAGRGSCLTATGHVEMDAGIMDGRTLACGAVGAVRRVPNPVRAARLVMEQTDHILLVGQGAEAVLERLGYRLRSVKTPERARRLFQEMVSKEGWWAREWPRNARLVQEGYHGTVGAVALDAEGNVASAVSTGGRWGKLEGRVGDSAIPGAGFYAENGVGAVCCTGKGEEIIRFMLARRVMDRLAAGAGAMRACTAAIEEMTRRLGENLAGVIALDARGGVGYAHNTEAFLWGAVTARSKRIRVQLSRA